MKLTTVKVIIITGGIAISTGNAIADILSSVSQMVEAQNQLQNQSVSQMVEAQNQLQNQFINTCQTNIEHINEVNQTYQNALNKGTLLEASMMTDLATLISEVQNCPSTLKKGINESSLETASTSTDTKQLLEYIKYQQQTTCNQTGGGIMIEALNSACKQLHNSYSECVNNSSLSGILASITEQCQNTFNDNVRNGVFDHLFK